MPQDGLNNEEYQITQHDGVTDYTRIRADNNISIKGVADGFYAEKIECANGLSGYHELVNANVAIYTNAGDAWYLDNGQSVNLTFNTKRVEGLTNGQGNGLAIQKVMN